MFVLKTYHILYQHYGPQGWWPLINRRIKTKNNQKKICHYHPGDYSLPKNRNEIFEIGVGAILTQNTTFISVEECLFNLNRLGGLTCRGLQKLSHNQVASAIIPARYPNRKAEYLYEFADFFSSLKRRVPQRQELLSLRGVGEETADSILLYGFGQPEFVVDSYTKRILSLLKFFFNRYCDVKMFFENKLKVAFPNLTDRTKVYQEYHALIVKHAKIYYSRNPYGKDCFLKNYDLGNS